MSKNMGLIMESWRTSMLSEDPTQPGQEYGSEYIEQISVGEFLQFIFNDYQMTGAKGWFLKMIRYFTDTQKIHSKEDSERWSKTRRQARSGEDVIPHYTRLFQRAMGLLQRGGIGALFGLLMAADLSTGAFGTVLIVSIGFIITQYGAEFSERVVVKQIEKSIGFNANATDYKPKEMEMVFGVEDSLIRLMRGGDASPGARTGNTEIAQEFQRQAINRLSALTKEIIQEVKNIIGDSINIKRLLKAMKSGPTALEQEMKSHEPTVKEIQALMKQPITKYLKIEDTFSELAVKIISKQIKNKSAINIPSSLKENKIKIICRTSNG